MAEFTLPDTVGGQQKIVVNEGEALFVVGANGTGKSSLMQRFFTQHRNNAKRISAHRQTWFTSNTLDFTPATRKQTGVNLENDDAQESARWMDSYGSERSSAAIFDLINADNIRSRKIAEQIDLGSLEAALATNEEEACLGTPIPQVRRERLLNRNGDSLRADGSGFLQKEEKRPRSDAGNIIPFQNINFHSVPANGV